MLHNRPHLGQGGSPGLPPSTWRGPVGPGAEGNLSVSHPSLFPLPPWGDPRLGTRPFANTSRGRGRDGIIAVLFNQNWKRDHVLLSSLPRRGRDTVIALLYWPPPLSLITSSSLPLRVWINSGQSCRCAALKCHRKAIHRRLISPFRSVQS